MLWYLYLGAVLDSKFNRLDLSRILTTYLKKKWRSLLIQSIEDLSQTAVIFWVPKDLPNSIKNSYEMNIPFGLLQTSFPGACVIKVQNKEDLHLDKNVFESNC